MSSFSSKLGTCPFQMIWELAIRSFLHPSIELVEKPLFPCHIPALPTARSYQWDQVRGWKANSFKVHRCYVHIRIIIPIFKIDKSPH